MVRPQIRIELLTGILFFLAVEGVTPQEIVPPRELKVIRTFDKVFLRDGPRHRGTILTPGDPLTHERIVIRTAGSVEITIATAEIESVIRKQSEEQVYSNWTRWLTRYIKARKNRARGELELGRWCYYPHADLEGRPPRKKAALTHFENAVRLDPELQEAYPYLVAIYTKENSLETAPIEAIDREVESYFLAEEAGYESVGIKFRLGSLLAGRLGQPAAAIRYLEAVLQDQLSNEGNRRHARSFLAEAYFRQGEKEKALGVYENIPGKADDKGLGFESSYEVANLLLRMGGQKNAERARALLNRARTLQPDYFELLLDLAALDYREGKLRSADVLLNSYLSHRPGDRGAKLDAAFVKIRLGQFKAAEESLKELQAEGAAPGVHLALGLLSDFRANLGRALSEYRMALQLEPQNIVTRLMVASVLLREDSLVDARREVEEILKDHLDKRQVFGACARLLAALESRESQYGKARAHLEYAAGATPDDVALLERAGLLSVSTGELQRGATFLHEARNLDSQRSAIFNGLAYVSYQEGDIGEAERLFRLAQKLSQRPVTKLASDLQAQQDYSSDSLDKIRDLKNLEVWVDEFEGEDSALIDGWEKSELYGVTVQRTQDRVVFEGVQRNSDAGETTLQLMRPVEPEGFEKITVRMRLDSPEAIPSLRLQTTGGRRSASAGIAVYRDLDGMVKVKVKTSRDVWENPEVTAESGGAVKIRRISPSRHVYREDVEWTEDGEFHRVEIRRSRTRLLRGNSGSFDVYFDGQMVARNIKVAALRKSQFEASIAGRTAAIGKSYSFAVENFKVFRKGGASSGTGTRSRFRSR